MDCANIVKRGYLYDKKVGLLPVAVVSDHACTIKVKYSLHMQPL